MGERWLNKGIGLIYPPLCICCQQRTGDLRHLFCASCLDHLTLLDPQHRCNRCFVAIETSGTCPKCRMQHSTYKRHAAACEHFGPPLALLSHFKQGHFELAKTIASLMVMQHNVLGWPLPDQIIPYPTHLFPILQPQGKLTQMVAHAIGKILERPVCIALKKSIDFSYFTEVSSKEPVRFIKAPLRDGALSDKTLLLISLNIERPSILKASDLLQEVFPREIDSLSFLFK